MRRFLAGLMLGAMSIVTLCITSSLACAENPTDPLNDVQAQPVETVKVTDLKVPFGSKASCLCWSSDATAFYHLDVKGTVRRISFPEGNTTAIFETGVSCDWLCVSAVGLVLTVAAEQEAWVLDAKTLKVRDKFDVGTVQRVVSAPSLDLAFAVESSFAAERISVLDLHTGEVVERYDPSRFKRRFVQLRTPIMSPDGKYLFCASSECIVRFAVDGPILELEEISPRIIQGVFDGLCVSPDSDFICAPSGGGNYGLPGLNLRVYTTYIYSVQSFGKVALMLEQGAYPEAVGFDLKSGLIYTQNHDRSLIIFDTSGKILKEMSLQGVRGHVRIKQYLVHPRGRELIVMASDIAYGAGGHLWHVELPVGKSTDSPRIKPQVWRKWVDESGTFSVEAALIEVKNGKAYLRSTDGKKYSIPLDKLSEQDQRFVTSQTENE